MSLLSDPTVINALLKAWSDSQAEDSAHRHEEGGYIVELPGGKPGIVFWERGSTSAIRPATIDSHNCYNGLRVLATFHTHPNPPIDEESRRWEQSPGKTDLRWHAGRSLRGFVVSASQIYEIEPDGTYQAVGSFHEVLKK